MSESLHEVVGDWLYHNTPWENLRSIASKRRLIPGEIMGHRFVSFAGVPDFMFGDVILVFRKATVASRLLRVRYDIRWARKHPEHAEYIRGVPFRQIKSFHDMGENEWISAKEGAVFPFGNGELVAMMLSAYLRPVTDARLERARRWFSGLLPSKYVVRYEDWWGKLKRQPKLEPRAVWPSREEILKMEREEMKPKGILVEASPIKVHSQFDSVPYANIRMVDVARILDIESSRDPLNRDMVAKLIDRVLTGLEFSLLAFQGRPEGMRIIGLLHRGFNRILSRLPEFGGMLSAESINEAVERCESVLLS